MAFTCVSFFQQERRQYPKDLAPYAGRGTGR